LSAETLQAATGIAPWFVAELDRLVALERRLRAAGPNQDDELLVSAKRASFSDRDIAALTGLSAAAVRVRRDALGLRPG
jgi:carbamoyl-phosphate synthase large subunit